MKYHLLLPYLFSAQLSWNCEEFFQILQTTHRFVRVCLKMRFESATVTFPLSLYISLFVSLPLFVQWLHHVAPSGIYNFLILWCMRAFITGSQHCSPLPSCFACFNFLMFSVQLKTRSSFALPFCGSWSPPRCDSRVATFVPDSYISSLFFSFFGRQASSVVASSPVILLGLWVTGTIDAKLLSARPIFSNSSSTEQ